MPNSYPGASEAKTGSSRAMGHAHPGKITRGPGNNKPRIHLVSAKGKIPAGVYAEAIALKQKNHAANAAKMPAHRHAAKTSPNLRGAHTSMPSGVAKYVTKPKTGLV